MRDSSFAFCRKWLGVGALTGGGKRGRGALCWVAMAIIA